MSPQHDRHRYVHVIEQHVGRQGWPQVAPDRIQRARDSGDGPHAALQRAHDLLVVPVGRHALARGSLVGLDVERAADRAHRRVGEGGDERAHRRPVDPLARVAEHEDLSRRLRDRAVERRGLPVRTGQGEQAHAAALVAPDDLLRAIGGSVGRDHDFPAAGRVIELQAVQDLCFDVGLLVVRHDDDAHGRLAVATADPRRGAETGDEGQQQRISRVGVGGQRGRRDEQALAPAHPQRPVADRRTRA
jgi:hypothetical protein